MNSTLRQKLRIETRTLSIEPSVGDFSLNGGTQTDTVVEAGKVRITPIVVIVEEERSDDSYFYSLNRKLSGRHEFIESWANCDEAFESK